MICYERWSILAASEQDKPGRHECDNGTRSTVSVLIYLLLLDGSKNRLRTGTTNADMEAVSSPLFYDSVSRS